MLLVRVGVRRILPADYINGIRIVECDEPMVRLPNDERMFNTDGQMFVGRKEMVERLVRAAKDVAWKGYRLHIYQIYRSPEEQAKRRSVTYGKLKEKYPERAEEEILRMLNKATGGVGGRHQSGGAVDLGLCNREGVAVEMGTP